MSIDLFHIFLFLGDGLVSWIWNQSGIEVLATRLLHYKESTLQCPRVSSDNLGLEKDPADCSIIRVLECCKKFNISGFVVQWSDG
jgi:hypothetical protein